MLKLATLSGFEGALSQAPLSGRLFICFAETFGGFFHQHELEGCVRRLSIETIRMCGARWHVPPLIAQYGDSCLTSIYAVW
jgi:hypothetical protein